MNKGVTIYYILFQIKLIKYKILQCNPHKVQKRNEKLV